MSLLLVACRRETVGTLDALAALQAAGWWGKLAVVSPGECTKVALERVCGVLFADGPDDDRERDTLEHPLARWGWASNLPLLGIGRGAGILNLERGGGARSQSDREFVWDGVRSIHVAPGSRLASILGARAIHSGPASQTALDRIGAGLQACAFAVGLRADLTATVEAVEAVDPQRWVLGVRWHLENPLGTPTRNLFAAFVREAMLRAEYQRDVVLRHVA